MNRHRIRAQLLVLGDGPFKRRPRGVVNSRPDLRLRRWLLRQYISDNALESGHTRSLYSPPLFETFAQRTFICNVEPDWRIRKRRPGTQECAVRCGLGRLSWAAGAAVWPLPAYCVHRPCGLLENPSQPTMAVLNPADVYEKGCRVEGLSPPNPTDRPLTSDSILGSISPSVRTEQSFPAREHFPASQKVAIRKFGGLPPPNCGNEYPTQIQSLNTEPDRART